MTLTIDRLKQTLSYNPETGIFTRLLQTNFRYPAGRPAGTLRKDGYVQIGIDGVIHQAHRLAWFYVNGVWPVETIDHINTVRSDNRIANLREATYFENAQNIRRASVRNKSGLLGVSPHKSGMWRARIMKDGKSRVTWHHTPEAAHAAYIALKTELHQFSTLGPLGRQGSTHDNSSR